MITVIKYICTKIKDSVYEQGYVNLRVKNQVQLITYPDSLSGNLKNLNSILTQYFQNLLIQAENTKSTGFIIILNKLLNGEKLIQDDTKKLKEVFIELFTEFSKNNIKIIRLNVGEDTIEKFKSSYYSDEADLNKAGCSYYYTLNCDDDGRMAHYLI
jgi:hypothetical protein